MSNEPTIEQMNIAIAKFMELEKDNESYLTPGRQRTVYLHDGHWMPIRKLKYHSSWDWLMPVVGKIETPVVSNGEMIWAAADVEILYKACIIEYEPDEESGDTNEEVRIQTSGETKLEAVHKAVYQFIQWLNQSTTTNDTGND